MYDLARITVKAGNGGDGAISFRREKFVPFGGPDGGDGGDGGNVILIADTSITSLNDVGRKRIYRAGRGSNGQGSKRHGKRGEDLVIRVPAGTLAMEEVSDSNNAQVADLEQADQRTIVAEGGRGGMGNTHFASSTNQTPRIAQKGEPGEEKKLLLELRLIADVGIIGYPNVGKSTLLSNASAAKPQIADYPFTTREPVVGVVEVGTETFVLAEVPGLIEGAHSGRGLGHDFLRHATRTKIFIHMVDGSSPSAVENLTRVNTELSLYDTALARKPQLVVVNKIDLPEVRSRLNVTIDTFRGVGIEPVAVSAVTGEGVAEVMTRAYDTLQQVSDTRRESRIRVFRPVPQASKVVVSRDGDTFVVEAPELQRIIARSDITDTTVRWQLNQQLERLGINRTLKKAGAIPGDKVRCGEMEWEY